MNDICQHINHLIKDVEEVIDSALSSNILIPSEKDELIEGGKLVDMLMAGTKILKVEYLK